MPEDIAIMSSTAMAENQTTQKCGQPDRRTDGFSALYIVDNTPQD